MDPRSLTAPSLSKCRHATLDEGEAGIGPAADRMGARERRVAVVG